jgi:hypothetical protein
MSFNAISLAKLGVGFGALAVASIGLLAPTPVEAEDALHQGGPDKQLVERITRPANWTPKHELDLDVPESPYARPAPVITTVPGEVPTAPLPKVTITAKPTTVAPISVPAKVAAPDTAAPLSEQDALAMVLAALFVLDDD